MSDQQRHSCRCPLLRHVQIVPAGEARVEPHTKRLGKCSKIDCMMKQRFDRCPQHIATKLMLLNEEDGQQRMAFPFVYGKTVHQIAGGNDVSVKGLTESGAFKSMTLLKDKDIKK